MNPAPYIDYTLLKSFCTTGQVVELCQTATKHGFAAVCIPPYHIKTAVGELSGTPVKVCTVVGFPLGMNFTTSKLMECELSIQKGAQEIDLMLNLSAFKSGELALVKEEIVKAREQCVKRGAIIKVIIESGVLDIDELAIIANICAEADVHFVKTSTGFVNPGAEIEKIRFLREILPAHIQIKASGGVRTLAQAQSFLEAGATRIGTSSVLV